MTTTTLLRRAARLWRPLEGISKRVRRHNQRAWIAAVQRLGDKWLLAEPARRIK